MRLGRGLIAVAAALTVGLVAAPTTSLQPAKPPAIPAVAGPTLRHSGDSGMAPASISLAATPPMGWNGFNRFHLRVTAAIVETEARALVASGMQADGYTYVNLDGGWDLHRRAADGSLLPDPAKFPQGIRPLANDVHRLGLKFGIYISAGTQNCAATSAGSYGHYRQDAATFASWGVDYVKFDWCYVPYRDYRGMSRPQVSQMLAGEMQRALAMTRRPMVLDINDPSDQSWTWAGTLASLWRTTPDVQDSYASMVWNFLSDVRRYRYARPGHWNDPDMLEIGNGRLTVAEEQAQFSLWAELAAPLIAGNDLATMSPATRAILTNTAVIAVDQDALGIQGYPVAASNGHWVLSRPLANGDRAVVLFNQTDRAAVIATNLGQLGIANGPHRLFRMTNLWTDSVGETTGAISAAVPPGGVVMYRVGPAAPPRIPASPL